MKLQIQTENPIEPLCPHFGACGGCKFQHIPYDEQLAQKEAYVRSLFDREVDPILPCEPPWRYRNKMEFSFSQAKSGEKFLGLMRKRGRVENLEACFLVSPWFCEILEQVRSWFIDSDLAAYHPPSDRGALRTLTVREAHHTGQRMVVLTVSGNPEYALHERHLEAFQEAAGDVDALLVRTQIIAKKTPTRFEERLLSGNRAIQEKLHNPEGRPYLFRIRAASFFQPNTVQAEALYARAMECGDLQPDETVFDLYCGTGTIGIFASGSVRRVWGIESVPEAIEDARANLALNKISNMDVELGEVGKQSVHERPDTVIVDPPRVGLAPEALAQIVELAPKKIVYVSCNPETQAQNCQILEENGYCIERLAPVDQFPHTPHVENVAALRRKT